MLKKYLIVLLFILFVSMPSSVMAISAFVGDPAPPGIPPPPRTPIDGGLAVLIAIGVGLGIKKLSKKE